MKKMKSLFVAIMLFVGATSFVNAQNKIAHIDTQALAESMPEMKAAQSQLENLQRTYDTEIKTLVKEFETKIKQYDEAIRAIEKLRASTKIFRIKNAFSFMDGSLGLVIFLQVFIGYQFHYLLIKILNF